MNRIRAAVIGNPSRSLAAVVALAAGVAVFVLATEVFPLHSSNHDEGVYLQQAAMLLEGRLWLSPGSEALREAVHPWFFVEDTQGFYPKYAPVPAAVFAIGMLAGEPRVALAAIAAVIAGLVYALTAAAFDRPTGVVAAGLVVGSPLFLLTSAVFLPYAPTTALNLVFALAYVRSVRRSDWRYAGLAGTAIGLAFFARPYTALLFAIPFIMHAGYRLASAIPGDRGTTTRYAVMAAAGLVLVAVTLAYNALMTGHPLRFPYEAFAPRDGPGFGERRILGHAVDYGPTLAVEANSRVVTALLTRWFTAGVLGTAAAILGAVICVVGTVRRGVDADEPLSDRQLRLIVLGVAASVVAGNVLFWGNLNILGDPADPGDGLISLLGPFYHFDALLPLSAFAAHGIVTGTRMLRRRLSGRLSARALRAGAVVLLVVALPVVAVAETNALGPPIDRNAAYTEKYERANEPFAAADLDNALVFLPPTYGEWRNHPFQWLRNDPGLDGPTVYVLSRNPPADFAVMDDYPDRRYYRYRHHGEWTPRPDDHVHPVLDRVRVVEAETVAARTTVTVPDRITGITVAVAAGDAIARYEYDGPTSGEISVDWTVSPAGVRVDGQHVTARSTGSIPVDGPSTVALTITLTEPGGGTLTYREDVLVRPSGDRVDVVWPPTSSVCTLVTECGADGTYVADRPETRPDGIGMRSELREPTTDEPEAARWS